VVVKVMVKGKLNPLSPQGIIHHARFLREVAELVFVL
jgi:hypothetical protein